jgi:hypothetical protein
VQGVDLGDAEEYSRRWLAAARSAFREKPGGEEEFEAFLATGVSNGRPLEWVIMEIQPHQAFPLHAHPVSLLLLIPPCDLLNVWRWEKWEHIHTCKPLFVSWAVS